MGKLLWSYLFVFVLLFVAASCTKKEENASTNVSGETELWLVPPGKVLFKDLPKDRIPSIDDPQFIPADQSNLKPDDLVLVARIAGETRIYPVRMMDAHEIVNDNLNDQYFAITYCPRTGSGMKWNRKINGKVTEFGVSGMLYNENLMPYDRETESIWSQMKTQCVHGKLMGSFPETSILLETRFSTIKAAFPDAKVLDHTDCESGSCGIPKHGGFLKDEPVDEDTVNLPSGQQYFGVVKNSRLLLFNFKLFNEGVQLFTTNFQGASLIICGSNELHLFTAFLKNTSAGNYSYTAVQGKLPVIMKDNFGNLYDIFGEIVQGPEKGKRLEPTLAYFSRTFAWELFFNDIELYRE